MKDPRVYTLVPFEIKMSIVVYHVPPKFNFLNYYLYNFNVFVTMT